MPTYTEIERKYDVERDTATPPVHELPGVAKVAEPVELALDATYFDTRGLALAAARITLRRRTGGADAGWHLKLPLPDGSRQEVREPLGDDDSPPPDVLREHVLAHVLDQDLLPVARLRTRRTVRRLLDSDGIELAELCDDEVTAERLHPDLATIAWREWEFELVEGTPALLKEADQLLTSAGAVAGAGPSKLARVLGTSGASAEDDLAAGSVTTGDVVQAYLREIVDRIKAFDPLARQDADDAVHKMRTATRRIRSVLATYRPILRREETDPVRDELKWLAGELALARDSEVMQQRLQELVDEEPATLVLGPVRARIDAYLGSRHREGREHIAAALNDERYLALLASLSSLVQRPPFKDMATTDPSVELPRLLHRDGKRLRKRIRAADEANDPGGRDLALHEVRKAAKRLRYAADSTREVLGKPAKRLSKSAKAVQDTLGEHQDTVVARTVLRTLGVQAYMAGENAFTFGRLHAREEARAEDLREAGEQVVAGMRLTKIKQQLQD